MLHHQFSFTSTKGAQTVGGVCGCVCLREITSWLWINQERNDRSSCHYVEKHNLFISVCDYSCDGKCDLRCITTNIISLTALAHYRTKRQPFCLALSECASILIEWHLNPHFIQHSWCHIKRPCHTFSFSLTKKCTIWGSPYDFYLPLKMFQILLSNSYATCLPSFLSFSCTHIHTNAPKRPTWDKMRLIEEPISHLLPHPPCPHTHTHTHTHLRSLSHWACCPEVTLSWIDKVSQKRKSSLDRKGKVNN